MYTAHQSQKPQRPKMQSFQAYETPSPSTPSGPGGLFASCRALQSMLEGPAQQIQSPSSRSSYHPNSLLSRSTLQPPLLTPPCSMHKRGREEFEEDCMMSDLEEDQIMNGEREAYQISKRQRSTAFPSGPRVADFRALLSPRTPQLPQITDIEMCLTPSQDTLELDASLQHFSHSQLLPVHSTARQNFWASGRDRQLVDAALATVDLSTQNPFDPADHRDQQTMLLDQQWLSFSGEANIGLSVR